MTPPPGNGPDGDLPGPGLRPRRQPAPGPLEALRQNRAAGGPGPGPARWTHRLTVLVLRQKAPPPLADALMEAAASLCQALEGRSFRLAWNGPEGYESRTLGAQEQLAQALPELMKSPAQESDPPPWQEAGTVICLCCRVPPDLPENALVLRCSQQGRANPTSLPRSRCPNKSSSGSGVRNNVKKPSSSIRIEKPAGGKPAGPGAPAGGRRVSGGALGRGVAVAAPGGKPGPGGSPHSRRRSGPVPGLLLRWKSPDG